MVRRSFDHYPERETLGTDGVVDFHDFNRLQDTRTIEERISTSLPSADFVDCNRKEGLYHPQ